MSLEGIRCDWNDSIQLSEIFQPKRVSVDLSLAEKLFKASEFSREYHETRGDKDVHYGEWKMERGVLMRLVTSTVKVGPKTECPNFPLQLPSTGVKIPGIPTHS